MDTRGILNTELCSDISPRNCNAAFSIVTDHEWNAEQLRARPSRYPRPIKPRAIKQLWNSWTPRCTLPASFSRERCRRPCCLPQVACTGSSNREHKPARTEKKKKRMEAAATLKSKQRQQERLTAHCKQNVCKEKNKRV